MTRAHFIAVTTKEIGPTGPIMRAVTAGFDSADEALDGLCQPKLARCGGGRLAWPYRPLDRPIPLLRSSPEAIRLVVMLYVRYPSRRATSRICCSSEGSTFVMRRCGCGGTGSVRCSPPTSAGSGCSRCARRPNQGHRDRPPPIIWSGFEGDRSCRSPSRRLFPQAFQRGTLSRQQGRIPKSPLRRPGGVEGGHGVNSPRVFVESAPRGDKLRLD
jgi:hypothetical protein